MHAVAVSTVVILLTTGCSQSPAPPEDGNGHQLGVAGSGVQAGTAGADQAGNQGIFGTAGAGTGGIAGAMGTVDAGAAGVGLTLTPAPSVDLVACSRVTDDGTSRAAGECFLCCAGENLINFGFFQGACACAGESADASACVSEPDHDACVACCTDASFRGTSFAAGPPTSCTCHGHTNLELCAPSGDDPGDCAVCCVNAGYVSSRIDGGCVCADG